MQKALGLGNTDLTLNADVSFDNQVLNFTSFIDSGMRFTSSSVLEKL